MGGSAIETLARVHDIAKRKGNNVCAECPERSVKFASMIKPTVTHETVGVFICEGCYKHHFRMGTHFCETKSLEMATDWTRRDVANLSKSGNDYVNSFYEAKLESDTSFENDKEIITFDSEEAAKLRASFIKNKYIRRKYYCQQTYMDVRNKRNKEASRTSSTSTESTADMESSSSHSSEDLKPRRASTGATPTGKSSRQQHYASALERNCKEGSSSSSRPRRASVGGAMGGGGRRRASLAVRTKIQQSCIMENISERDQLDEEEEEELDHADDYSDSYYDEDGSSSEEPAFWEEQTPAAAPQPPMRAMRRASMNSTSTSGTSASGALQRRQQRHAQANVRQPSKLESFLDKTQKEHTASTDTRSKQQRRCHSVVGTEDSRVPASKQQDQQPKLYSDKVNDGVVDVSADEMQRLKAAKAARRAKRRSSTATGEGRRPSSRRGSSPKGVREETARMSKSMNENGRRRNSNRKLNKAAAMMPDTSEPAPRSSIRRNGSSAALTGSGLQF